MIGKKVYHSKKQQTAGVSLGTGNGTHFVGVRLDPVFANDSAQVFHSIHSELKFVPVEFDITYIHKLFPTHCGESHHNYQQ